MFFHEILGRPLPGGQATIDQCRCGEAHEDNHKDLQERTSDDGAEANYG
jgi:hypothetical protein